MGIRKYYILQTPTTWYSGKRIEIALATFIHHDLGWDAHLAYARAARGLGCKRRVQLAWEHCVRGGLTVPHSLKLIQHSFRKKYKHPRNYLLALERSRQQTV